MTNRWFKMPVGTAQNPVLAMVAKKTNAKTPFIIGIFCAAADLYAAGKNREDTIEILEFLFQEPVADVIGQLEQRGLFDDDGSIAGIEKSTPDAERARRYRERKRDASRDANVTQREPSQSVTRDDKTPSHDASRVERPDQKDQRERTPLPPAIPTNHNSAGQGSGSFSRIGAVVGLVGKGSFDIRDHIGDEDTAELYRTYAVGLGWDMRVLYEKYNAYVANDPPRQPGMNAFLAWAKKFTKGRRA